MVAEAVKVAATGDRDKDRGGKEKRGVRRKKGGGRRREEERGDEGEGAMSGGREQGGWVVRVG